MISPPVPSNEIERLAELYATHLLDSSKEDDYDQLTILAGNIFDAPISLITLVDAKRQWFKSCIGLPEGVIETPRELSFCAHAINDPHQVLIIENTLQDDRFKDNPLVIDGLKLRSYAGAPLISSSGNAYGTICVADIKKRTFTAKDIENLKILANQAIKLIDLRVLNVELQSKVKEKTVLLKEIHHRVKNNLQMISSLLSLQARSVDDELFYNAIDVSQNRIRSMAMLHEFLYQSNTLSIIEMGRYIDSLFKIKCKDLTEEVEYNLDIDNIGLELEHALPVGLILNELISNSIKYATIKGKVCHINLKFSNDKLNGYTIEYSDNGPGIHKGKIAKIGIGMDLIQSFVGQLNGTSISESSPEGFHQTITFSL